MSDYTLTQADYKKLKAQLTRKQNRFQKAASQLHDNQFDKALQEAVLKEAKALQAECERALTLFASKGYPDAWSNWERAKGDAEFQIRRYTKGPGIYSW
jgi:hypothetical protein